MLRISWQIRENLVCQLSGRDRARRDVFSKLENWSGNEQDKCVFWLNGLAGTGKSTIVQTFTEMSFADGELEASFFCLPGFEDRSTLQSIFPTVAPQLSYQYPHFQREPLPVLTVNPDVGWEILYSQTENLSSNHSKQRKFQPLSSLMPSISVGMRSLHRHCSPLSPATLTRSILSSSLSLVSLNLEFDLGFI